MVEPAAAKLYPVGTVHVRKRTHSAVVSLAPALQATRNDATAIEFAPGTLQVDGETVAILVGEPITDPDVSDHPEHTRRLDDRRRAALPPDDVKATLGIDVDAIDWSNPPMLALLAGVDAPIIALAPRRPFELDATVGRWEE